MDNEIETLILEEIHGFRSPGEFDRFVKFIEENVIHGNLIEIEVSLNYCKGEIYGGRWFKEVKTCQIWRLVPPDPPFLGLWEVVILR